MIAKLNIIPKILPINKYAIDLNVVSDLIIIYIKSNMIIYSIALIIMSHLYNLC